jgi:hypothetical protein
MSLTPIRAALLEIYLFERDRFSGLERFVKKFDSRKIQRRSRRKLATIKLPTRIRTIAVQGWRAANSTIGLSECR